MIALDDAGSSPVVIAAVVAALLMASLACLGRARSARVDQPGRTPGRSTARVGPRRRSRSRVADGSGVRRRVAVSAAVGFVVLLTTGLVVLGAAAAAVCWWWGRIGRDRSAEEERRRLDAVARWLEDLRDALRGSSVSAEEALDDVAARPPEALADAFAGYVNRRRRGIRIEDALDRFADDVGHPVADAAVVAIQMVVGGAAGGGRLHPTVSALAAAARDEVRSRQRVDRARAVYRASMVRLVVIGIGLVLFLRFGAGDLLDPYATPVGQVVLLLPVAMWAGCIGWMNRLCRDGQVPRRLLADRSVTSGPQVELDAVEPAGRTVTA